VRGIAIAISLAVNFSVSRVVFLFTRFLALLVDINKYQQMPTNVN